MYYFVYRSTQNYQWYWRLYAANNKVIADSGEGYVNKQDCLNGIALVKASSNAAVHESR